MTFYSHKKNTMVDGYVCELNAELEVQSNFETITKNEGETEAKGTVEREVETETTNCVHLNVLIESSVKVWVVQGGELVDGPVASGHITIKSSDGAEIVVSHEFFTEAIKKLKKLGTFGDIISGQAIIQSYSDDTKVIVAYASQDSSKTAAFTVGSPEALFIEDTLANARAKQKRSFHHAEVAARGHTMNERTPSPNSSTILDKTVAIRSKLTISNDGCLNKLV